MRGTERVDLAIDQTGALTDAGHAVVGGEYAMIASGTVGTDPVLQIQSPLGTWLNVGLPFAADTVTLVKLPPGQARANLAVDAAAAYVYLVRVPAE